MMTFNYANVVKTNVREHKYVFGPDSDSEKAQNLFMPKNIHSITINISLEANEKIKTEENDSKIV